MPDEYWQGQIVSVQATLTDPANAEALTDDPGETLAAVRPDGTSGPTSNATHPSLGIYRVDVTTDQSGWWEVNDGRGGVYQFYVKPS
jgi:hypothetical protein